MRISDWSSDVCSSDLCCDQGRSLRPPVNNGDVPSQTELRSALRTSAGKLPELPILKTFLFRGSGGRVDLWSRRRAWVSAHRLRLCRWLYSQWLVGLLRLLGSRLWLPCQSNSEALCNTL